jgi:DNA invertase Pin-like site-specific DNA recombinase
MAKADPQQDIVKAAAGYLRRSTDRQEQSLEDQRRAIELYAGREGYNVVEWFVDDAISGTTTEARKAFQAMIETSQKPACPFRYVLVYDVKRFGRVDTDEAGYYRHLLRRAGVEVVYTSEGFNGGDSDDLVRSVKQWQARAESKDLSKVTIRGQVSVVDKGYWCGGVPPYGYDLLYEDPAGKPIRRIRFATDGTKQEFDADGNLVRTHERATRLARPKTDHPRLVLGDPDRVALVRRIFRMYVEEGLGYRAIAEALNAAGTVSPRDGTWSKATDSAWGHGTIRSMILNGTYTGDTYWNRRSYSKFHRVVGGRAQDRPRHRSGKVDWNPEQDWIIIKDTHPAIISRETFRRVVQERGASRLRCINASYRRGPAKSSPYLLSGLLRCACGHAFIGHCTKKHKRTISGEPVRTLYYVCGGYMQKGRAKCTGLRIPQQEMESLIWRKVRLRLEEFCIGSEKLVERMLRGERGYGGADPEREARSLRALIEAINHKAEALVDGMTAPAASLVRQKLDALGRERRLLEQRLSEAEATSQYHPPDPRAVVGEFRTCLARLRQVREFGTNQQRKTFLRGMIERIEVKPRLRRARLCWHHLPRPAESL